MDYSIEGDVYYERGGYERAAIKDDTKAFGLDPRCASTYIAPRAGLSRSQVI